MSDCHLNDLSKAVIGAAIDVHRQLGPGLLEGIYEEALCYEMGKRKIPFERQQSVPVLYKGVRLATSLRLDLIVSGVIIVELKSKDELTALDRAQLLSYLRLRGLTLGLLINFNVLALKNGIARVVNGFLE